MPYHTVPRHTQPKHTSYKPNLKLTPCQFLPGIHGRDLDAALETYDLMSRQYFTHATPTLYNAGTPNPQLSSCFLLTMKEDSIDGIYDTLKVCGNGYKELSSYFMTSLMSLSFGESSLHLTHPPLHIYVSTAMCCHFQVCWRHRTRLPQYQSVQLLHPRHQRLVKRHCSYASCVQQYCQICRSRRRKEER